MFRWNTKGSLEDIGATLTRANQLSVRERLIYNLIIELQIFMARVSGQYHFTGENTTGKLRNNPKTKYNYSYGYRISVVIQYDSKLSTSSNFQFCLRMHHQIRQRKSERLELNALNQISHTMSGKNTFPGAFESSSFDNILFHLSVCV